MRRLRALAAALALPLLLSGCGKSGSIYANQRALEQLRLVRTLGLDAAAGGVTLTVSTGKGSDGQASLTLSRSGPTITQAMASVQDHAAAESLYYTHAGFLLVGQETAEAGLLPLLDFVTRSPQLRLSTALVAVRDGSARETVAAAGGESGDVGEALEAVKREMLLRGKGRMRTCGDLCRDLSDRGAGLICAVRPAPAEGAAEGGGQTLLPAGYGVVLDGRVAAWLEGDEARGVNLLQGNGGAGTMTVDGGAAGTVALTIDRCETAVSPVFSPDGSLEAISVEVALKATVVEISNTDVETDDAFLSRLGREMEREAERWIAGPLALSRTLGADCLGMGPALREKAPAYFRNPDWAAALAETPFRTAVSAEASLA